MFAFGPTESVELVNKQDLRLALRLGRDPFVEDDVLPQHQPPRQCTGRDPQRGRVDRAVDPDALLGERDLARQSDTEQDT